MSARRSPRWWPRPSPQAKDAAELVGLDIDPLPAVTEPGARHRRRCPDPLRRGAGNVGLDFHYGDSATVAAAFAGAAHVTRLVLRNNRIVVNPMEPRAALAEYDAERRHFTLHVGCQGVFGFRNYVAQVLGVGRDQLRILTDRVGGSFGMKQPTYGEYYCILHAARELRRPVKWTDERSGSFVSDSHGRDHHMTAELALDGDGNFLAVRLTGFGNLGSTYGAPGPATRNAVRNTLGVYKTPLIEVSTKCTFTNTTPVGAYRGAGRPEANYYMERLVDAAAAEIGIDRLELRRKQPHPARGDAVQKPERHHLRQRRVHRPLRPGPGLGRLGRLPGPQGREPGARPAARHRHRRLSRTDRPARPRDGRHPLRAQWRRDDHHRHPRLRPGPRLAVRPGAGDKARHPVPPHPPARRATATN